MKRPMTYFVVVHRKAFDSSRSTGQEKTVFSSGQFLTFMSREYMNDIAELIDTTFVSNVVVGCHCTVLRTSLDFDNIEVELN